MPCHFVFLYINTHVKLYQVPDTKPNKFLEKCIMIYIFITLTSYSSDSLILKTLKFVLNGFITLTSYNIAIPETVPHQDFVQCGER